MSNPFFNAGQSHVRNAPTGVPAQPNQFPNHAAYQQYLAGRNSG